MSVVAKKPDLIGRIAVAVPLATVAVACLTTFELWGILMLLAVFVVCLEISLIPAQTARINDWALPVSIVEGFLLAGGLCAAIYIRKASDGVAWLVLVLVGVIATDVGAYFGGRVFGTPGTFFPRLSPNKSRAGAIAGVYSGIIAGFITAIVIQQVTPDFPAGAALLVLLSVPFVAIAGDLLESGTKRLCGIKDFTVFGRRLLGPHGGIADRIDALAPAWGMTYLVLLAAGHL